MFAPFVAITVALLSRALVKPRREQFTPESDPSQGITRLRLVWSSSWKPRSPDAPARRT